MSLPVMGCLCALVFFVTVAVDAQDTSVIAKMSQDSDLSEFYSKIQAVEIANVALSYKEATIFAPINEAFQGTKSIYNDPEVLVMYHISCLYYPLDKLRNMTSSRNIISELSGNPPLWITQTSDSYHNDIYINNARILMESSNVQGKQGNLKQVMHKIDEVLFPTRTPKTSSNPIADPTAWEFIDHFEDIPLIHPHRLRSFRKNIQNTRKERLFSNSGSHTFFMPVDEGYLGDKAVSVDDKTIDGHVIPNQVLFTAPTKKDVHFQTLANENNNIRVVISFTQEKRQKDQIIYYVKSDTLVSDGKHTKGVVLAEIVKPNIPVKNGVVHLIHKPLMVVDGTVRQLLEEPLMDYICNIDSETGSDTEQVIDDDLESEEKDGGILNNFIKAIKDAGLLDDTFYAALQNSHDVTLFAPCNSAWNDDQTLPGLIKDKERFREVLNMHLVVDNRLYINKITSNLMKDNQGKVYQTPTQNKRQNLYFNVNDKTVTVEGGGVNATIIQQDLAAKNGIIHIIDRILGVPSTTVLDKLRTDPMMSDTYKLGNRGGFNEQLNDTNVVFTYFVPHNIAWKDARSVLPSHIKKLFMPDYARHAGYILERHLVISDRPYTMERLKNLSIEANRDVKNAPRIEVDLPSMRDNLTMYVEELKDHKFVIHWRGKRIQVFRPNVECTNGIIHVIDYPLIQAGDVQVNGGAVFVFGPHLLMLLALKLLL